MRWDILGLFDDAFPSALVTQRLTVVWVGMMWKEVVVVYFNALYQYTAGVTEETLDDLSQDCGFLGWELESEYSK
jgi:hypothetical protein